MVQAAFCHAARIVRYWDKNSVKITNLPGFGKLFSCSGASMPKSHKWCLPDKACRLLFECGKSSLHVPRMRHKIRLLENILNIQHIPSSLH